MQAFYDDGILDLCFTAHAERCDYGVQGSPVWNEICDVKIDSLKILGVKVPAESLPLELQDALIDLAHDLEWHS